MQLCRTSTTNYGTKHLSAWKTRSSSSASSLRESDTSRQARSELPVLHCATGSDKHRLPRTLLEPSKGLLLCAQLSRRHPSTRQPSPSCLLQPSSKTISSSTALAHTTTTITLPRAERTARTFAETRGQTAPKLLPRKPGYGHARDGAPHPRIHVKWLDREDSLHRREFSTISRRE